MVEVNRMLKSNLAVLMAERGLKIADVYEQTGISKTTLMSLADNKSKGVQFETIDKLCNFFGIDVSQFFVYSPYLIKYIDKVDGQVMRITSGGEVNNFYFRYFEISSDEDLTDDDKFGDPQKEYDYYISIMLDTLEEYDNFDKIYNNLNIWFQKNVTEELFKRTIDIFKEGHQSKKGKYLCAFNIGVNRKCVYREKEIQV